MQLIPRYSYTFTSSIQNIQLTDLVTSVLHLLPSSVKRQLCLYTCLITGLQAVFMHCMPAQRGAEVNADVIDGPQSVVLQQAENRLHAQKALMAKLLA